MDNLSIHTFFTYRDRATYDPSLKIPVSYSVSSPLDAPESLTFGPSYMDLAGSYDGSVTIGLDRRLNNISNTIAAAEVAVSKIPNLYAIELGNEPNCKLTLRTRQRNVDIYFLTHVSKSQSSPPKTPSQTAVPGTPQQTQPPKYPGNIL